MLRGQFCALTAVLLAHSMTELAFLCGADHHSHSSSCISEWATHDSESFQPPASMTSAQLAMMPGRLWGQG